MEITTERPMNDLMADYLGKGDFTDLALFMKIGVGAAKRLLTSRHRGLTSLKLAYFFEGRGDKVAELDKLPREVYELGKLLTEGTLSQDTVVGEYPDVFPSRDSLNDIFRRPGKRGEQTLKKISAICSASRHPVQTVPTVSAPDSGKDEVLKSFASMIEACTALGKLVLSDRYTDKERHKLRIELLPGGRLTRFSDIMNALTSERAREQYTATDKYKTTIKR
ncbi:hypothetical protein KGQ27_03680 [Patescibacteria group bacterium]|nr:hypothetical protein [Patescibacteria group bacterium]MDE1946941.1 hypothetical protein [Patescibacteria group bacterium]MDE2011202.1 hypothetical protein [Patescibacteria group bacterium]MDE2233492.1 hypothetical protein [Patescibacteria group bacterium]